MVARSSHRNSSCLDCGYTLTGLTDPRCPECGRAFDPADPDSYWHPDRVRFRPVDWSSPPSLTANRVFAFFTFVILIGASEPVNFRYGWVACILFPALPIMVPILIVWAGKMHTCHTEGGAPDRPDDGHSRFFSARWLTIPVCVALCLSTATARPWPMLLRFGISQSSFERALIDHNAGRFRGDRWVGLYRVHHVIVESGPPGGTRIGFVTGFSAFGPIGFEFDPQPGYPVGGTRQRVAPDWYTFED